MLQRAPSPYMSEFTVYVWENKWGAVPVNFLFPSKSGYFFTSRYQKMKLCLIYLVLHIFTFILIFVVNCLKKN